MIGINLRTKCWDDDYCYASTKSVSNRSFSCWRTDCVCVHIKICLKRPLVIHDQRSLWPPAFPFAHAYINMFLFLQYDTLLDRNPACRYHSGRERTTTEVAHCRIWMRSSLNPTRQTSPRTARMSKSAHFCCGRSKCGICDLLAHLNAIGHLYGLCAGYISQRTDKAWPCIPVDG